MEPQLSESQREALRAFCDTIVPSIQREPDPEGFWGRRASDLGIDAAVADLVLGIPDETVRGGLLEMLDVLASQGIARPLSELSREQIIRNLQLASPDAAAGVNALQGMTCFLYYGAPDPQTGQNPNWKVFGYSGPASPAPDVPKPITPLEPEDGTTLEADAVIVGSGCGGGVIAGALAKAGLKVIVVEAGGYFNESDFAQLELKAYQEMYWRGGPNPTADGNISLQAGTTLGGGSVVNWQNCLRTKPWVREDWARDHGLEGLDGPDYDRHLDIALERISATEECSEHNGPHQRLKEGCEALGWDFRTIVRNADPSKYTPEHAGFAGFGDQSGSKQSTDKTWILDAVERGGEVLIRTRAQRVLTENGRAAGVECVRLSDDGMTPLGTVTVRAPRVVVACGSLESPALLLRSGIGGPAVGRYLRLHPALAVTGIYSEDQRAWWGAPQTGLCDTFVNREDGHGHLIEGAQYAPAISGSATPWVSGEDHKERMADWRFSATIISLIRDRGHGQVTIDGSGEAVPTYSVDDELDRRNLWHAIESIARIHHAAGAKAIMSLAAGAPMWRYGDDLEAFIARATRMPLRAGGQKLFSAHQLGSCRMGNDPKTSVANPWGELHDTPGVWIGDGSAFPTATGTNPMISIMALAHRTAEAIAGSTDTAAREPAAATAS